VGGGNREAPVTLAYVGLGANVGDREGQIRDAAALIGAGRLSRLIETEPWGLVEQPAFLNAAAEVETALPARAFLDRLLAVERRLGRLRTGKRWGPRTIDLDLLLFGDETIDEPGLTVPHPFLLERAFALEPLRELAPTLEIPGNGTVEEALAELQSGS
jgi:2-amino-4-hydroxy-6-hydroxymethyldihydropteridine diphosphokinase